MYIISPVSYSNLSKVEVLHLADFDGVCVKPGLITLDSLLWKANEVLKLYKATPLSEAELNVILKDRTGTTELNFLEGIMDARNIPKEKRSEFTQVYLKAREAHLLLPNKKIDSKKFGRDLFDTSYPDALHYFRRVRKLPNNEIESVTGNPRGAFRARLKSDTDWKTIFTGDNGEIRGAFGDEALSRSELILLAIARAEEDGFVVKRDSEGYTTNVFYYGDAAHDLIAGINSKTRTIFLTRDEEKPFDTLPSVWVRNKLAPYMKLIDENVLNNSFNNRPDGSLPRILYATNFLNPSLVSYTNPKLWEDKELMRQVEQEYLASFSFPSRRQQRV